MDGYRNQAFSAILAVMSAVFGPFLRLARAGAYVDDRGVRIVNPRRTVRLPWGELAGLSLRAKGGFPALGFAELRDGTRV